MSTWLKIKTPKCAVYVRQTLTDKETRRSQEQGWTNILYEDEPKEAGVQEKK